MSERVFIGLGGNLGDPARNIAEALARLDRHPQIRIVAASSLYRTAPWGRLDQPDFINAAAELATRLAPRQLLAHCLEVERALQRVRDERWGPRTIDIDILLFGDRALREEGLEIPHPRLAERAFALVPLVEIAPDVQVGGETVAMLAGRLDASGVHKLDRRAFPC